MHEQMGPVAPGRRVMVAVIAGQPVYSLTMLSPTERVNLLELYNSPFSSNPAIIEHLSRLGESRWVNKPKYKAVVYAVPSATR